VFTKVDVIFLPAFTDAMIIFALPRFIVCGTNTITLFPDVI
jgi:hypothetical protein